MKPLTRPVGNMKPHRRGFEIEAKTYLAVAEEMLRIISALSEPVAVLTVASADKCESFRASAGSQAVTDCGGSGP